MKDLKILIAGAGLGGLAAACALTKAGHRVEVYEQAPQLGEVGAGIQVSANATHALRDIGVLDEILKVAVKPGAYVFRAWDTGEVLQRFALSEEHERLHGAPYVQIHRADLHEILATRARELDPDMIHLNHVVTGFSEDASGVELHFADGTSARGDMLIGADGLKSAVRAQIAGEVPATYTGDAVWRLTVPTERLPAGLLDTVMNVFMGPGAHVVCYYLRGGELVNFVASVETEEMEESYKLKLPWERLKADMKGWSPIIQAIIDAADKDECYLWSLRNRPAIPNWSTARATLLGDAAHPTLPYLAQGAVMAFEDGAVLTRSLAQADSISDALQLYQRNRIERTTRIVNQSTANRSLFHMRSPEEMREAFAKRDEGADRNAWLYSYNPLTVELA